MVLDPNQAVASGTTPNPPVDAAANPAQVPPTDATAQAVANPNVNTPSGAPATVTTPGMSAASANTVAAPNAPNGQPTTAAPATTATAPQAGLQPSGAPAFSPEQQALRAKHPIATKINDVASVLAGGRQYETIPDPVTGEVKRVIKPVSTAHLGMAIALEALRGALAGGAAKGPNAVGQAGVAGAAAGQQQVEQQRKQQEDTDARAQRDLQTRWSTMDNNMKMRQSAIVLGRLDRDANEQSVSDNASTIATAEQLPPITVQDSNGVKQSYSPIGDRHVTGLDSMDAKKYPVSVWNRVPDGVTDRTNTDGSQVWLDWRGKVVPEGTAGAYKATDRTYTMIHKDTAMPLTMQDESGKTVPQQYIKDLMPYVGIIPGVTKDMDKAAAGQTLGFATVSRMLQGKTDIDALQSELNGTFKRLGLDSETTSKAVFDGLRRGDLSMDDLHNFQRAIVGHGGSMQPWDQLQSMMASPDTKIQASAPRIAKLFNLGSDPTNPIGDNLSRLKVQAAAAQAEEMSGAKDPNKIPATADSVASVARLAKQNGLDDAQSALATAELPVHGATVGDVSKALENIRKQADTNAQLKLARDREADKNAGEDILTTADALGFVPAMSSNSPGSAKEYNKRMGTFKKNTDDLSKTEGTYQQFQSILDDINAGKDMSGAQSVVALFNAIGISATPLAGKGFRINQNTIAEHAEARGLGQDLYQKLLKRQVGDVITPQQVKDYATIAAQARQTAYISAANQAHNMGLHADFVLPTGNGQKIDPNTVSIFLKLAGGDKAKARAAATEKGWTF